MKNINEALFSTGAASTQPTLGTTAGKQPDSNSINIEISKLSNVVNAAKKAGQKIDPTVEQTLLKLKQAAALAAKKAADAAKQAADLAQKNASSTGTAPTQPVKVPGQADEEKQKTRLNNFMSKTVKKESADIVCFLKAISQKNYAQADKYLQSAVDAKLKASISKAVENSK